MWIDSSIDMYIYVDTALLASAIYMPGEHFCCPGYVTVVTSTLSTTPASRGPRLVVLEFPSGKLDEMSLCVGNGGWRSQ